MTETDPTSFFEPLYVAAVKGETALPWDRGGPHPLIEEWARDRDGNGGAALVVGSGLGTDAEYLAEQGFAVTAFDVSPTAIAMARERFPQSQVDYRTADLLDPPSEWGRAFALVVESLTVQSMPPALHAGAIAGVAGFVAPGGTLLVVATEGDGSSDGPPWPLTRAEIDSFAAGELVPVRVEQIRAPETPTRWRAEFRRP